MRADQNVVKNFTRKISQGMMRKAHEHNLKQRRLSSIVPAVHFRPTTTHQGHMQRAALAYSEAMES